MPTRISVIPLLGSALGNNNKKKDTKALQHTYKHQTQGIQGRLGPGICDKAEDWWKNAKKKAAITLQECPAKCGSRKKTLGESLFHYSPSDSGTHVKLGPRPLGQ